MEHLCRGASRGGGGRGERRASANSARKEKGKATHKLGNNAMKDNLIIIVFPTESHKVLHRLWRLVGEQVDSDISLGRVNHGFPSERSLSSGRGSGDGHFVPSGLLVEDVAVVRFFAVG